MTHTSPRDDDLIRAVGRLEGKMDLLILSRDSEAADHSDRDDRINAIERGQTRIYTVAGGLAFIISTAVPFLEKFFTKS